MTGVVLAAGGSRRLGRPKQLLPFRGGTLLDVVLDTARACDFDQILVPLGGSWDLVRDQVRLDGVTPLENRDFRTGCASSLRTAVDEVDSRADGLVVMLGDMPGVSAGTVRRLVDAAAGPPIGVCRYTDGLGHPFWLARSMFSDLAGLHGDKAVWKLIHSGTYEVTRLDVDGPVPIDVDVPEDYERLLAQEAARG